MDRLRQIIKEEIIAIRKDNDEPKDVAEPEDSKDSAE